MPVWLGLIMLTGIVVNNAIVLVEQIEIEREKLHKLKQQQSNQSLIEAIKYAARLTVAPYSDDDTDYSVWHDAISYRHWGRL